MERAGSVRQRDACSYIKRKEGVDLTEHYPFSRTSLDYGYVDLNPQLDADSLYLHHNKLYGRYVDALNYLLSTEKAVQGWSLEELISKDLNLPPVTRNGIRHYAGAVYAHRMYFSGLSPKWKESDAPRLRAGINDTYGSTDQFRRLFQQAAHSVPGSGWVWLVTESGSLRIVVTQNNDIPKLDAFSPILTLDVWEHAYYLRYPARLSEYIDNWFRILNWERAEERYRSNT